MQQQAGTLQGQRLEDTQQGGPGGEAGKGQGAGVQLAVAAGLGGEEEVEASPSHTAQPAAAASNIWACPPVAGCPLQPAPAAASVAHSPTPAATLAASTCGPSDTTQAAAHAAQAVPGGPQGGGPPGAAGAMQAGMLPGGSAADSMGAPGGRPAGDLGQAMAGDWTASAEGGMPGGALGRGSTRLTQQESLCSEGGCSTRMRASLPALTSSMRSLECSRRACPIGWLVAILFGNRQAHRSTVVRCDGFGGMRWIACTGGEQVK